MWRFCFQSADVAQIGLDSAMESADDQTGETGKLEKLYLQTSTQNIEPKNYHLLKSKRKPIQEIYEFQTPI